MIEIAQATSGPKWFQLYWNNDLKVTRSLLTHAKAAGYTAIILTADALGPGQPDDFKAMGADAVAVGRPMMYGLGLGGAQGVESVINFLNADLTSTMLLTGAAKLSDLNPNYIEIVGQNEEYSTFVG